MRFIVIAVMILIYDLLTVEISHGISNLLIKTKYKKFEYVF